MADRPLAGSILLTPDRVEPNVTRGESVRVLAASASPADWLAAIGTVGTLVVTVALYWSDRYRRHQEEVKHQAALVSGWAERVNPGDTKRRVFLTNRSDEPVYEVNVFLPPRNFAPGAEHTFGMTVVPPLEKIPYDVARRDPRSAGPHSVPRPQMAFTDRNGQRWLRDRNGALKKLRDNDWLSHWR